VGSQPQLVSLQVHAQQGVHPTLGILAKSQAFFYASAFFQSDGVPPSAPARVTQTVRRFLLNHSKDVGLRREVVKVEQQGSFSQVEFRVSQVGSFGKSGFGYVELCQVRV
jgi:hypothetical protein